jgi:hypothetical protein
LRPLANQDFDPKLPLQTKKGAKQALRVGMNAVEDLIRLRLLETVEINRRTHIKTKSIMKLAEHGIPKSPRKD